MRYTADYYVYARGYYDGRAKGAGETPLDWMTPEEVGIYAEGYDRGVADYCKFDEPEQPVTCNVSGDISQYDKGVI